MSERDQETLRLASEKSSFSIHGTGTLSFTDEYEKPRLLIGEIIVARDSIYQDIYVQVTSDSNQFLMPLQSVNSIKWVKRIRE